MGICRVLLVSRWLLLALVCNGLLACGGGGGGGATGTPEAISAPPLSQAGAAGDSQNRPPTISGQPETLATAGSNYRFRPNSTDADGDTLSFSVANRPSWAFFNQNTGELQGTPDVGDVGAYTNIKIRVTDGVATTQLAAFTIAVQATATGGFTLSWDPPTRSTSGQVLQGLSGYRIYLGTQPGAYSSIISINNPTLTSYVFDQLSPGTYYVAISAIAQNKESERSEELSARI